MRKDFVFISESVTEGHPDKLCDQISDAVVDHFLQRDPFSRVIAECAVATSIVFMAARFESNATIDFPAVARQVISQVGYDQETFNAKTCSILTSLRELTPKGRPQVDERSISEEEIDTIVARNQATVFGFACNQSPGLMPLPIWLAHKLARRLTSVRLQKMVPYLAPDGKTQVGIEYVNGRPSRIHSITIIASQIKPPTKGGPDPETLADDMQELVIEPVFRDEEIRPDKGTRIFVNPDGLFITGGPSVHSGLTGKKNAIDTYGEYARHSGAALSGKGPLRVDRVGAYAARYAAKNIVAAGFSEECELQVSYTIGLANPVSIQVETFGTGRLPDDKIAEIVRDNFDFRPGGIIRQFNLRFLPTILKGGFYRKLAAYGHVGRMDIGLPWEITDKVNFLKSL
jgi:S-adenosylmethionine synthetase